MAFIQGYIDTNFSFSDLLQSVTFESVTTGRQAGNIVDIRGDNRIPIVRTTTKYTLPNQPFQQIHYDLVKLFGYELNNGMVELYDSRYKNMGFHSDMALDLKDDSYICIFSFYNNPNTKSLRKLQVKNKETNEEMELIMSHSTIIVFSLDTNTKHQHKIVLDSNNDPKDDTLWLGFTFRQSKTFIQFQDNVPYFTTGLPLKLANEEEKKQFYKCRSDENKLINYKYPEFSFTISEGDLIPFKTI